ncbi:MAG: hypothetical protein ABI871_02605 [Chthoniobacterales bacterium]
MTLENRRDLYSADPEIYGRAGSTTMVRRQTTRTTVRPSLRLTPAEQEEFPPLPGGE